MTIFYLGIIKSEQLNNNSLNKLIDQNILGKHNLRNWSKANIEIIYYDNIECFATEDFLILGKLFNHTTSKPASIAELISFLHDNDLKSIGSSFWGSYVIFYIDRTSNNLKIKCSYGSGYNLFYFSNDKKIIFGNRIEYIEYIHGKKLDFDHHYLCTYMVAHELSCTATPFIKVKELMSCTVLNINLKDLDIITENYKITPINLDLENYQVIPDILEQSCKLLLNDYDTIAVEFSGGVDSTALLTTIHQLYGKEKKIIALNLYNKLSLASDEIDHIKPVVKSLGVELLRHENSQTLLNSFSQKLASKPNKPSFLLLSYKQYNEVQQLVSHCDNPKIVNGHGGDHLFICPALIQAGVSFLTQGQINKFIKYCFDFALYKKHSFWAVLKANLSFILHYYIDGIPEYELSLINSIYDVAQYMGESMSLVDMKLKYPNYKRSSNTSIDEFLIYKRLYGALSDINYDLCPLTCYPLLSEPIISLAFNLKSYNSLQKGYDRYLFRKVFHDKFKLDNFWRSDKGSTTAIHVFWLRDNLEYIKFLLFDGYMIRNKLINNAAIESMISEALYGGKSTMMLINLISIEWFIYNWQ